MLTLDLKELMQKLVETEDQMERMSLVEANQDLLEVVTVEGGEDFKEKYDTLKKKYIETFFSGKKEDTVEPDLEGETKDKETERAETITIDDLLKKEEK